MKPAHYPFRRRTYETTSSNQRTMVCFSVSESNEEHKDTQTLVSGGLSLSCCCLAHKSPRSVISTRCVGPDWWPSATAHIINSQLVDKKGHRVHFIDTCSVFSALRASKSWICWFKGLKTNLVRRDARWWPSYRHTDRFKHTAGYWSELQREEVRRRRALSKCTAVS